MVSSYKRPLQFEESKYQQQVERGKEKMPIVAAKQNAH